MYMYSIHLCHFQFGVIKPKCASSVCIFDVLRVVYMLQSCPTDDAIRLLSPILSSETWVRNKLQLNQYRTKCPEKVADVCFWIFSCSPSALQDLV